MTFVRDFECFGQRFMRESLLRFVKPSIRLGQTGLGFKFHGHIGIQQGLGFGENVVHGLVGLGCGCDR